MFAKRTRTLRLGSSKLDYAIIPWDSECLNNTTVEIENIHVKTVGGLTKLIDRLQKELHLKKKDLLFCKIPLQDFSRIPMLHRSGFYIVEQGVTLDIDLSGWKPMTPMVEKGRTYKLIPTVESDETAIKKIARTTFNADRFHLDPGIPKANADRRFEMWIENSYHNSDSIYKFVDAKNTIIGFFIVREHSKFAEFRLAGLDPQYVGRGLGKILYHHMYRLLKEKKYTLIKSVISLNNIAVLNVYMYLTNAKCTNPLTVLHKLI